MKREQIGRKCILEGIVKPTSELLRFVVLENALLPDFNKKLGGKGIYITSNKFSLHKALEKKLFDKVSRHCLRPMDDFINIVENLLLNDALNSINLVRKSGNLLTGLEKVREAAKKNKISFIIQAADVGNDSKEKVSSFAKNIEILNLFNVEQLDKTLNKVNTVNIAFLKSDIAKLAYNKIKKYDNFLIPMENNK